MQEKSGTRAQPSSGAGLDPMLVAVSALGITQITAWGTSYYCLGVLAGPIAADTGWSRSFVFLGFSIALVVMGLVSTTVGRGIDRFGARSIMSAGTVIVSIPSMCRSLSLTARGSRCGQRPGGSTVHPSIPS